MRFQRFIGEKLLSPKGRDNSFYKVYYNYVFSTCVGVCRKKELTGLKIRI